MEGAVNDIVRFKHKPITGKVQERVARGQAKAARIMAKFEQGTEGILLSQVEDGQCRTQKGTSATGETLCCGNDTGSKRKMTCEECNALLRHAGNEPKKKNKP
jgi:hypothetical protein